MWSIAFDVNNRFGEACLWRVRFSPIEKLMALLHNVDAFQLWEVDTGGMVFKAEI
jgi:hypothetical protein